MKQSKIVLLIYKYIFFREFKKKRLAIKEALKKYEEKQIIKFEEYKKKDPKYFKKFIKI